MTTRITHNGNTFEIERSKDFAENGRGVVDGRGYWLSLILDRGDHEELTGLGFFGTDDEAVAYITEA